MSEFEYEVDDGKATIADYTGKGGDVIVPSMIDGFPVTTIGGLAFDGCTGLTSISLPDGCSIGEGMFDDCPATITIRDKEDEE